MTRTHTEGDLRRRAQERLRKKQSLPVLPSTEEELRRLAHELQVHQVELELQNEELARAKDELEESTRRYTDLYDFAPLGYFTLARDGTIRGANLQGANLLGRERSDLTGRPFGLFVAQEARPATAEFLARVFAGRGPEVCELPLDAGTGQPRHVRIDAEVSESGAECRAAVTDITERKRAEAERGRLERRLRLAQKMEAIGTLAAGIAHDFNNLLTPIVAHAELSLLRLAATDPARKDSEAVLAAALRGAALVRQILAIGCRGDESRAEPVNLGLLVRETAQTLRASLPATIEVRAVVDSDCGHARGDLSELHQVLLNLCANAVYAMQARGGLLSISLERASHYPDDGRVKLSVRDTGPGIPRDIVGRVFDPYFTTKPVGEGAGLGLAVVYGIVTKLGGQVRARSVPGEGATVEVLLPETERAQSVRPFAPQEIRRGLGQHVLLVDDEASIRGALVKMLVTLGYRVTECAGGDAGLAAFRADPQAFDVVLTDYAMPGRNGLVLAAEMLRLRPALPILLGTGFLESEEVNARVVAERGLRGLVVKPYTAQGLSAALCDALSGEDTTEARQPS